MESERNTSKNINQKDRPLLVELVEKNKHIIECKLTDTISNKKKLETWDSIRKAYNKRRIGSEKSTQQLKVTYKNIKGKVRKDVASERLDIFKTGGGTLSKTIEEDPIFSIVGKSITPNPNPYDSSADLFGDKEEVEYDNYEYLSDENPLNNNDAFLHTEMTMTEPTSASSTASTTCTTHNNKLPQTRKRPIPRKPIESEGEKKLREAQIEALQSRTKLNETKIEYYKKKMQDL